MKQILRNGEHALLCAAKDGSLSRKLKQYIKSCRPPPDADPKKDSGRMPTLAGFCGKLGCGTASVDELRREFPSQFAYLCAVLEDEALNSTRSPTIVNAYLKEHFGYGEKSTESDGDVMRLVFDHDILEDGS